MSKQRNIRKSRVALDEDEDDLQPVAAPAAIKATQKQRAKDAKTKEKKALLSFEDDVGGDDSDVITKKKSSKQRANLRAPGLTANLDTIAGGSYTQVSQVGEYSADRLKELHLSTLRAPGSKQPDATAPAAAFKLSGSFKPNSLSKPVDDRNNHLEAITIASGTTTAAAAAALNSAPPPPSELSMPLPPPSSSPPNTAAPQDAVDEDEELDDGDIPNEDLIKWAKAKRERLRSAHFAPDYIPTTSIPQGLQEKRKLDGGLHNRLPNKKEEIPGSPMASSGSDRDLEDDMRIKFMGGGSAAGKSVLPVRTAEDQDLEPDEMEEVWTEEQIYKGLGGGTAAASHLAAASKQQQKAILSSLKETSLGGDGIYRAGGAALGTTTIKTTAMASAAETAAITAAADAAMAAIQTALQRAQTSKRQAEKNLISTQRNLEDTKTGIIRAEDDLKIVGDRYAYVQQLRAYVADVCNMLQDKSPIVEELEEELDRLREHRARAYFEKCRAEDAEEHIIAEAALTAALQALSSGSSIEAATAAATAAEEAAQSNPLILLSSEGVVVEVELDEFGRDVNAEKKAAAVQRAKRRAQRIATYATTTTTTAADNNNTLSNQEQHKEPRIGESTSEESEGEVSHYKLRRGEVMEAGDAVFRDAAAEFSSLQAVKSQLEAWKAKYPAQYRDAYVSLSVSALCAPFVRLELLKWEPLENGAPRFDSHSWYNVLFDYGMPSDGTAINPEDPDGDLVPNLVRNLVLPLAGRLLEDVWNPYSRRQSRAAAIMLADVMIYLPPEDDGLQELIKAVESKLQATVDKMELPAWPPVALAASKRAELHLCHRFSRSVRLLQAISCFEGALPRPILLDLAVSKLIVGHLIPYIRSAAATPGVLADRVHRVITALPQVWLQAGPPRGLEGLLDVLRIVSGLLELQAGDPVLKQGNAGAVKQLIEVLGVLGDAVTASRMKVMYGIQ